MVHRGALEFVVERHDWARSQGRNKRVENANFVASEIRGFLESTS